jgi:hypothetical protein
VPGSSPERQPATAGLDQDGLGAGDVVVDGILRAPGAGRDVGEGCGVDDVVRPAHGPLHGGSIADVPGQDVLTGGVDAEQRAVDVGRIGVQGAQRQRGGAQRLQAAHDP